jgi:spore germination protein
LPWATKVADYVAKQPNLAKFILGTPLYGMDWPSGGGPANPATALQYADTEALAAQVGATPTLDPVAQELHFSYTSGGVSHDVWFNDLASVSQRVALARARGLGVGIWRLGTEDPAIWTDPQLG